MAVAPSHHDDTPQFVELLYERHAAALRAFCLHRLRHRDEADEAVQATFLRALGALRTGMRPYAERAWLLTIARNVCATRATTAHRRREVELDPSLLERTAGADAPELGADPELLAALDALPEGQRRAFVLRAVHDLSYRDIAAELGVGTAAVESWIFRARRSLAASLHVRRRFALNLPSLLGAAKSLLPGSVAAKLVVAATVAATAVTAEQLAERALQDRSEASSSVPAAAEDPVANASGLSAPPRRVTAPTRRPADVSQRDAPTTRAKIARRPSPLSPAGDPSSTAPRNRTESQADTAAPTAPEATPREAAPTLPQVQVPTETPPVAETPVEVPQLPAAPSLPTETPSLPVETPSLPVEVPSLPVEVPSLPVEVPPLPPVPDAETVVEAPTLP